MPNEAPGLRTASDAFLAGGGEMGALMRGHAWEKTPLGPAESWPRSLKTALRIMLNSRQPIWVGWGPDLIFLYNDPYQSIIGGRHPWALGQPARAIWQDIWEEIGPLLATAMGGEDGTYVEQRLLVMERNAYPEETYYTFSFSSIPDDDGQPAGIFCANTDDTERVIGQRQLALLRDLAAETANRQDIPSVCAQSITALGTNPRDITFALIYMAEGKGEALALAASLGAPAGHPAAPAHLALSDALWPIATVLGTEAESICAPPHIFPAGIWSTPSHKAAVLPLLPSGSGGRAGVLIVGLNPFRLINQDYRGFLRLAAGQISAAIAHADAYAEARRRAASLAELDRAKTVFFSNISHEFRTPLTLMLGPAEEALADAECLPPEEVERARTIHRNCLRLLKLVNELLDFSRIEAGQAKTRPVPTDLATFTALLASNFRSLMEKAGLTLEVDCPPLSRLVPVDRDMWEKIVLNLLSNAFKFTFEGRVQIRLIEREGAARLIVQDSGIGIAAQELPRLFERFHRIEGARGRSIEGSGIGLTLVQELVHLHGGTVTVASEEGRGSCFTVEIPLAPTASFSEIITADQRLEATPHLRAFMEEAMRWLPVSPGESMAIEPDFAMLTGEGRPTADEGCIIVADDNADMRSYLRRLLGARYRCKTAADGAAALALIRAERPDLVLADVMMPGLDGFGLLQAIRDDTSLRDLPVIMLSARAGEEASVEGLTAGADGYLVKPFSARELMARVDGALALARIRREMGEALREEARSLEILNEIGAELAAELDLDRAVQRVTDAATALTGAAYGAFFFNTVNEAGEAYVLFTLSGAPRSAFAHFPLPRNTALFAPTFAGTAIIRSDDILQDPRHGQNPPYFGMPKGHLPVRSYLAVPVTSRSGEVLGGLLFGHPEPCMFTERDERLLAGIAGQAAIAIDNARLYRAAQNEISRRRTTEAALRESQKDLLELNQTLEARVSQRTAELATAYEKLRAEAEERAHIEQVLRQSQKMEAVGKLTGGVAHDFNNLLQVIGGNLQLLAKDVAGNDRAEQRLQNALSGVLRGSKLASQLLAFGRRQPLAPKVVNLGRFIRGLDDLLCRALGDGIETETVIAGGLWNTLVDPIQVESALLNLAINARDAMAGHGRLTIEAGNAMLDDAYAARHGDVEAGQYIMLAVTDTGCGMTPEVMEQVFEPFFTTKPEGQGTGLGLSMVYGFVKQSHGHIKIYSEPGHGTTIRIYLPRVHAPEDTAVEVTAGPIEGGSETVLVVEDDEDVRQTVVELLTDLGYRVLKAPDAQSALAIIAGGVSIDLLFTDVVMPGALRSPDLARRAQERLPGLAVLFTSGYTDNAIVHGGRLDAGIELLSKPYTREALARKVRHVLHNQSQRNAARVGGSPSGAFALSSQNMAESTGTSLNILLVEDDALIRLATADLLIELGHRLLTAELGAEAEAILAERSVDLLLVDLGLPDMSGRDLALLAIRRQPHLPIVFATGQSTLPDGPGAELLAKAVLLRKPYDRAHLLEALAEAERRRLA
jgi:signal transduction histidine kinase/DNA-binding response OmpR family regulator